MAEPEPAAAAAQAAGKTEAAAGSSVVRRGAGDLAEVMRRRRDVCEEYESVPSSSTADCVSAPAFAEGANSEADVAAAGEAGTSTSPQSGGGAARDDSSQQATSSPAGGGGKPVRRTRLSTDCELNSWMVKMRGRCQVLESEQVATAADAHCEGVPSRAPTHDGTEAVEAARARLSSRSPGELHDWMARMRARCQILESTPDTTTADAKHEDIGYEGPRREAPPEAPVPSRPSRAAPRPPEEAAPSSAAPEAPQTSAELLARRLRLRDGTLMAPSERLQVWQSVLLREPSATRGAVRALPALVHLLGATEDEDVLFDARSGDGDSSPAALCNRLAVAFSEKYVTPLAGQASSPRNEDSQGAPVYSVLAQLLRYHYPAAACAIEAVSVPAGFTLPEVLGVVCGGPAGLAQCLLTPHGEGEADALLLFCDLVVMEEEEMLILLAAAVLLSEVVPEPGTSLEHAKDLIRGKRGLGGLGARGPAGACQCVAAARALLDATPVSLTTALSAGGRGRERLRLPMCAVAPDEALHHVYERPSGSWRLVVVDVRMRASVRALPVCMRLGQSQHTQRRQMLRELPYEEPIHLCLLGDGPCMPGDDAFELCRHLVSPSVQRKHVSVVDGGWPALEELADSLRLHLMPLDPEEQPIHRSGLREARAAVAEVAGQVASATETATAVGQKVAQRVLKGARGAALSLLGADGGKGHSAEEAKKASSAAGEAK